MKTLIINNKNIGKLKKVKGTYRLYFKDTLNSINSSFDFKNSRLIILDENINTKKFNLLNSAIDYYYLPLNKYECQIDFNLDNSTVNFIMLDLLKESNDLTLNINLNANSSKFYFNGATISSNKNLKTYQINTDLKKENMVSKVNFFGMAKDLSKITCNITANILKNAINSNIIQNSKILLIGEDAKGVNNPILLIGENEVEANHAASIGKINDEEIFYLMSRGISKESAENMICYGNIIGVTDAISDKKIKRHFIKKINEELI